MGEHREICNIASMCRSEKPFKRDWLYRIAELFNTIVEFLE